MLEMVQAEGGMYPVDPVFVDVITKLCREHGLLLIIDEVQTGMGRTGKLFSFEHYGIEPDIFTLAKGLGSGFSVGAMLGKGYLCEAFTAGSHGSTFGVRHLLWQRFKLLLKRLLMTSYQNVQLRWEITFSVVCKSSLEIVLL